MYCSKCENEMEQKNGFIIDPGGHSVPADAGVSPCCNAPLCEVEELPNETKRTVKRFTSEDLKQAEKYAEGYYPANFSIIIPKKRKKEFLIYEKRQREMAARFLATIDAFAADKVRLERELNKAVDLAIAMAQTMQTMATKIEALRTVGEGGEKEKDNVQS